MKNSSPPNRASRRVAFYAASQRDWFLTQLRKRFVKTIGFSNGQHRRKFEKVWSEQVESSLQRLGTQGDHLEDELIIGIL